ncbi:MAG: hypothetical protein ABJC98_11920 [Bacteroidota bacterium]
MISLKDGKAKEKGGEPYPLLQQFEDGRRSVKFFTDYMTGRLDPNQAFYQNNK